MNARFPGIRFIKGYDTYQDFNLLLRVPLRSSIIKGTKYFFRKVKIAKE